MRPIKFRALATTTEDQKEWFYYSPKSAYAVHEEQYDGVKEWIVKDLQFTGLLDKNGKEIYEGDVVGFYIACGQNPDGDIQWDGAKMKIEWDEKLAGFKTPYSDVADKPVQLDPNSIKVLGNIYEHPNLLK